MSQPHIVEQPATGDNPRANWPLDLQKEFDETGDNGVVGSVLVSETDRVRVWHLQLPPGKRCHFHTHVLDYFWTCHSHGKARGWYDDGRIQDVVHYPGETNHFKFAEGESFTHAIMNVGDTDLLFTAVEYLDSCNEPYTVPDSARLQVTA